MYVYNGRLETPAWSLIFWDLTQHRLAASYQSFGTTYRSHLQWSRSPRRMMKNGGKLLFHGSWKLIGTVPLLLITVIKHREKCKPLTYLSACTHWSKSEHCLWQQRTFSISQQTACFWDIVLCFLLWSFGLWHYVIAQWNAGVISEKNFNKEGGGSVFLSHIGTPLLD
jgi:hypothetical protein